MGAEQFTDVVQGGTAQQAFNSARDQAAWELGHSGYTGSIAEKHDFVHIAKVETATEAHALAEKLLNEDDSRIDDKWGPAGCIEFTAKNGKPAFLFFGWASS